MSWYTQARAVIQNLDQTLPADMPLAERTKAVRDAYPFGARMYHPYRAWLRAQREYLNRFRTPENDPRQAAWKSMMEARGYVFGERA